MHPSDAAFAQVLPDILNALIAAALLCELEYFANTESPSEEY